ncbi:MAG: hypothetical protein ISS55_07185 [Dehalococcoidales bacterium]|nr:hypothetical protein [Dehalococcoidales bacterium]
MAETTPEKKIRCPACERLFPISELREHQRRCPEMVRLDRELVLPGRNLRK